MRQTPFVIDQDGPDHAPTLEGESNDRPGYSMGGKLFAFGYMKGAMDAMGIPYV